ncbi:hypothetical protein HRI_002785400 [Hibiscus trionum]|uniref:Uncharacterized protein n=1 Tax=Hibiscus trionum TaxID=183268 RepID=A0A9W7M8B1_HIBTR|nr:hypothetical protein HRI_002785400 [Hibiscus trionum]
MQKQNILYSNAAFFFRKNLYGQLNYRIACTLPSLYNHPSHLCKYMEQGVSELCKGAGEEDAEVIFLKHNASIFYTTRTLHKLLKDLELGQCLFNTSIKMEIIEAIKKYTSTNQDD